MGAVKHLLIAAGVLVLLFGGLKSCEAENDQRQREHDAEIWKEAYESGQMEVIENPEKYIEIYGDFEDGYNEGYRDGWADCDSGYPLPDPPIDWDAVMEKAKEKDAEQYEAMKNDMEKIRQAQK